jgi:hypothetical protein
MLGEIVVQKVAQRQRFLRLPKLYSQKLNAPEI